MAKQVDIRTILGDNAPRMLSASLQNGYGPTICLMADEWFTVLEAMAVLNLSRSRVYALKEDGTIRWEKSGRILKLNAEDVRREAARDKKPGWPKGQPRTRPGSTT